MKRKHILSMILIVIIVTTAIIEINHYTPKSKADTASSKSISVTYKPGEGKRNRCNIITIYI